MLFDKAVTDYANSPRHILLDAVSCKVTEEINGVYELELVYPYTGRHIEKIEARSVILAKPNPKSAPQPFRVYKISKERGGLFKIRAGHISYDLSGIPVEWSQLAFGGILQAFAAIKRLSMIDNNFILTAEFEDTSTLWANTATQSVKSALISSNWSIANIFKCEFIFDNLNVTAVKQRGSDKNYKIIYGKNLISAEQENVFSNMYTGVIAYSNAQGLPTRTGIIPVENAPDDFERILVLDLTDRFYASPPNAGDLEKAAKEYISDNKLGEPRVSFSVDFVHEKSDAPEIDLSGEPELGDRVSVIYEKYGIWAGARINKTVFDTMTQRYTEIQIGNYKPNLPDTVYTYGKDIKGLKSDLISRTS